MIRFATNQKITISVSAADKNVCGNAKQKFDYKKFKEKLLNMPDTKKSLCNTVQTEFRSVTKRHRLRSRNWEYATESAKPAKIQNVYIIQLSINESYYHI